MNEWWPESWGVMIGAFGGAFIGMLGATLGPLAGVLAPRGKCKRLVIGAFTVAAASGAILLGAGVIGLIASQPRHVWLPLLIGGVVMTFVFGPLLPVIVLRYRQAEQRRFDAEQIRRS